MRCARTFPPPPPPLPPSPRLPQRIDRTVHARRIVNVRAVRARTDPSRAVHGRTVRGRRPYPQVGAGRRAHQLPALSHWPPAKSLLDLITTYPLGSVWAREGLDRRTRGLLNLALLTALNRLEELRLNIHGALRNGCSDEEMAEVTLQCAAYAGAPAGIALMKAIHEVHNVHEVRDALEAHD
ncbi:carboxymuconolactone decarboxylase family protein [Streptomyces sp. NPDC001732]